MLFGHQGGDRQINGSGEEPFRTGRLKFAISLSTSRGKLKSSALPFSLFAPWVGCFPDLLSRSGYVMHGLWDLSHCLSGSSLAGLSITEIPLGYGIFCSTYDFVVAYYLMISDSAWHASGRFDPYFWRVRPLMTDPR